MTPIAETELGNETKTPDDKVNATDIFPMTWDKVGD